MSLQERLVRIFEPVAKASEPPEVIVQRQSIRYAFGQDRRLRRDAVPHLQDPFTKEWIDAGTVATSLLLPSCYFPHQCQLREIQAYVVTAPTGSSIVVDVETHDNDTLGTVKIAAGENYGATSGLTVDVPGGTWLRVDIQQVGSSTPGSNLTVVSVFYPMTAGEGGG
ncbi:MAG: hypothetical protein AB7G88_03355 [Thermomicrobiales bacterium]